MENATLGFRTYKLWQISKRFVGTFRQAQTLKLGGVTFIIPLKNDRIFTFFYLLFTVGMMNWLKWPKFGQISVPM